MTLNLTIANTGIDLIFTMMKNILIIILSNLFSINCFSQEIKDIYSAKFIDKNVKLTEKIIADNIESDSLVLRNDGTYENFYSYSFFDEFGGSKIIGTYEISNKEIILYPQTEFDKTNKNGRELKNYSPIHCQIINDNKINAIKCTEK